MPVVIGLGLDEFKDPLNLYGGKAPESLKASAPATPSASSRVADAARPNFSSTERKALVDTLIAEAGAEGTDGMKAVAAVIKNRSQNRGKSPFDIVAEPKQFTGYEHPGRDAVKAQQDPVLRQEAEDILDGVFSGSIDDPTGGADHYHAQSVNPDWASKLQKTTQIGRHLFYRSGASSPPAPKPSSATAFAPGLAQDQGKEDPFSKVLTGADKPRPQADTSWLQYANKGATRSLPLDQKLVGALGFLPEMGVTMEVFSGGQSTKEEGGPRTGSDRHDHGGAADVFFYKDGRRLDWANAEDVPVFQEIVRRGKENGITGFGAGDGYMQPGSMHLGFGKPAVWGAGGKGANAPGWLRSAYAEAPAGQAPAATADKAEKSIIISDAADFKDPMGLYGGKNPFAASDSAGQTVDPQQRQAEANLQAEQNRMNGFTQQHNDVVDQQTQQLTADGSGNYSVIDESEVGDWQKAWDEKNRSTGRTGDLTKRWGAGAADTSSSIGNFNRLLIGKLPGGDTINAALDNIDRWFLGRTREELLQEEAQHERATLSKRGEEAMAKDFWDEENGTFGPAWSDPDAILGMLAESGPSTLATMLPAGAMARGAFAARLAAGATREEAAAAAAKVSTVAGGIAEGLLGGAQSAQTVKQRIAALPPETILQSDAAQRLIEQGKTPNEAIAAISEDAQTQALVAAGVVTGIFGGMGDRAIAKIVGEGVAGGVTRRVAAGAAKGIVGEGLLEEAPQSLGQTLAENAAVQRADPSQSLTEGAAESVASGLAGGAAMGGAMGGVGGAVSPAHTQSQSSPKGSADPDSLPDPSKGPLGRAVQHAEEQQRLRRERDAAAGPGAARAPIAAPMVQKELATIEQPDGDRRTAEPSDMPPIGSTVRVDAEGVEPFMGRVEGHEGDEVIVADTGSGEVYQLPRASVVKIADSPETREAANPTDRSARPIDDIIPDFSNDPALKPQDPVAGEVTSEPIPERKGTEPALARLQGAPKSGQRVIIDDGKRNRFPARIERYEEGGTEALVKTDAGEELQVPVSTLYTDKSTPKQIEAEELRRNPPVEREVGDAGPKSRKVFGNTVVFPDEDHAALYDLAKDRMVAKKLGGAAHTDLDRVSSNEVERLAAKFKVSNEALISIADDYRYRADRSGRDARSKLPQKLPPVNSQMLRKWQSQHSKETGGPQPDASDLGYWWDVSLSFEDRKRLLAAAGVKRPAKTMWQHFTPKIREKLAAVRGVENREIAPATDSVAENADTVDVPTLTVDANADSVAGEGGEVTLPANSESATDQAAHEAATSPKNDLPEPTQAQKEAGNYKVGKISLGGLNLSIENPEGSERKGVDAKGKPWSVRMLSHYGYVRGSVGADKDHIDVFVRPGIDELSDDAPVYVVDQRRPDGKWDEHKVMLGYSTEKEARGAYLANYTKGWRGMGDITGTTLGDFKRWLAEGDTAKPFAPQWFTTQEKAEAYVAKRGMQATHQVENRNGRYEIHPVKEVAAPAADQKTFENDDQSPAKSAEDAPAAASNIPSPSAALAQGEATDPAPDTRWADDLAKDVAGLVVRVEGDLALIQGHSILSGAPVYLPALRELGRGRVDVDSFTGTSISGRDLETLRTWKAEAVAADQQQLKKYPQGPFGEKGVAASDSIDSNLVQLASELARALGLKARLFITSANDMNSREAVSKYRLHGPYAAIRSGALSQSGGSARRLSNGDYNIVVTPSDRKSALIETLAHELGHVVEREALQNAPREVKDAITDAYKKWLEAKRSLKASEYVRQLRAYMTGRQTKVLDDVPASQLPPYWTSFSEWFADNVAKWATTAEAPVGLMEKYFARIAGAYRRMLGMLTERNLLPDQSVKVFLDGKVAKATQTAAASRVPKTKKPKIVDRMENYFRPGRRIMSYGGGTDEVLAFHRDGETWSVTVAEVKNDGTLDRPRVHLTPPEDRELAKWEKENPVAAAPAKKQSSVAVEGSDNSSPSLAETGKEEQGPFGPVLRGYEGKWKEAAAELERRQAGDAIGALHHPEVGPIDLVWGKEGTNKHDGYGLAKLIAWHPEALTDLQGMLDGMTVVSRSDNRIMLARGEKDKAAVRLDWDGKAKAWLISAYEMGKRRSERSTLRLADIWEDASSSPPPDTNIENRLENVEGDAVGEDSSRNTERRSRHTNDLSGDREPASAPPRVAENVAEGTEVVDPERANVADERRSERSTDRPAGRQEDASSSSPLDAGSGATTDTATAVSPDDTAGRATDITRTMSHQVDEVERPNKRPDQMGPPSTRDLKTHPLPPRDEGTPILQWAKKTLLTLGRKSGHEHLIAVDDDGSIVASGSAGKSQRTGMSDELYAALSNPDRRLVVFHNHPGNSPVSLEDISVLPMPGLHSIWSIGHGGRDTRIELTDAARAQIVARGEDPRFEAQRIMRSITPAQQRLKASLQRLVNKRVVSPEEAQLANDHLPSLIAERAGIIGFETSKPYDPSVVPGLNKQIDGAAAAVAEDFFNGRGRGNPVGRSGGPSERIRHVAELGRMEGRSADVAGGHDRAEGSSGRGREDDQGETEFWEGVNRQFAPVEATRANIVSAISDAISGKFTDAQPALLATVPLNYFPELSHGRIPAIADYLQVKRQMDAYRGEKHDEAVHVIDEWRSFMAKGFVGIDRHRADQLADLMHAATLAGIDPSLTTEEERAKPGYAMLRKQFTELPAKGREVFTQVRDAYRKQADETDQLLLDHVKKAQQIALAQAETRHKEALAELAAQDLAPIDRRMKTEELQSRYKAESTRGQWAAKARLTKLRQQFESNRVPAPYFPLARFGRYFVTARDIDGTVLHFSRHEGKADMANALRMIQQELPNAEVTSGVMEEAGEVRKAMDPRVVAEIEKLLADSGVDPSIRDALYQRYLETMPDLSMRKRFIHRKGTAGYNKDAFRVFASTQFHAAHQMARLKFGLDLQENVNRAVEQAKALDDNTREMTLVNEFQKRDAWVRNPTGAAITNWLTSAAYVWYMGASPAAALVNASQTWMVGVPLLGAKFGIANSSAALATASWEFLRGKGDVRRAGLSKDERAAMDAFYKSGLIDRTQSHDLAAVGETGTKYNPIRAKVMKVLSWGFHNVEVANREITALAAYRLARDAGQDADQAIATAHERTYAIHFDMSNSSRPRIMQSNFAKVALMFRAYQINMLYRLFRDAHQAFQGESRQVRREAQVQLAGSVGMMSLMAGMTGTVGYGFIMAAAEIFKDIFGDDDDPLTVEDRFKAGVVETLGPELGGMVLNGVPGHLLGIDLTSRIGMPDLWFRSSGRDLSGKEWWDEYLLGSLGAGASMIGDLIEGYKVMTDGDSVARGIEVMAPKAVRDVMKMWRYAHEGVKSRNGDEVLPVDEVSWADDTKQFIGFTPAKIAEVYDRNSTLKNAEKRITEERRRVMNRFATAVEAKDPDARKDALEAVRKFNMAPSHVAVRITGDALKQSLKTRARNRAKRVDGALIQNEELGAQLRKQLAEPVYR